MPKREERAPRFREEAQRLREQAGRQVTASVWDRDPIKQYVRRFGWLQVIQNFAERRQGAGVDCPLKYLTIPGPNASDIGLLWQAGILTRTNDGFPYVVICDKTSAEQVVANLGRFLGYSSQWLHLAVRGPKSELAPLFPFDVINMDISQPVISGAAKRSHALRNVEAIQWIFQLQQGQSFLLLLTTLPDSEAKDRLKNILVNNLDQEKWFREAYEKRYGSLSPDLCMKDYTAFTQFVVPKVVAKIARDLGYASHEHFAARYSRQGQNGTQYELVCHSFEFEPLGRRNANKYKPRFKAIPQNAVSDELSNRVRIQSAKAYEEFLSILIQRDPEDVRAKLREDADLRAELARSADSLDGWWKLNESPRADSGIY